MEVPTFRTQFNVESVEPGIRGSLATHRVDLEDSEVLFVVDVAYRSLGLIHDQYAHTVIRGSIIYEMAENGSLTARHQRLTCVDGTALRPGSIGEIVEVIRRSISPVPEVSGGRVAEHSDAMAAVLKFHRPVLATGGSTASRPQI